MNLPGFGLHPLRGDQVGYWAVKAFGGGAETWYRLQSAYDLAQAMKNAGRIDVERISTPV